MAAGDLTDLATCYVACKIDTSTPANDTVLSKLITAISSYVPQAINCNILSAAYSEYYVGNGKDRMLMRQRPITAVASVAWLGNSITTQGDLILGTTGVATDGRAVILVNGCFPQGQDIRINYTAGYATVPADMSLAVAGLVAEEYARRMHVGEVSRSQGGQVTTSFDTKAMHAMIKSRLMNYIHGAPV